MTLPNKEQFLDLHSDTLAGLRLLTKEDFVYDAVFREVCIHEDGSFELKEEVRYICGFGKMDGVDCVRFAQKNPRNVRDQLIGRFTRTYLCSPEF